MSFSKELKDKVKSLVKPPNDNPPIIVNGKVDGYYNDLTKEGKEMYDDGMRFNLPKKAIKMNDNNTCAFQYYDGETIIYDKANMTLNEAKETFNRYYEDMHEKVLAGQLIEVVIWINMKDSTDYKETLIHLYHPFIHNGLIAETKHYSKFDVFKSTGG